MQYLRKVFLMKNTEKKLSNWKGKGKYLCVGGPLVLINSVLSSLPTMFMLSFF
jgi:hypothetical protein